MAIARREFLAGLGSAAAWPLAGRAQPSAVPMVGYLYLGSAVGSAAGMAVFRKQLSELGFIEGRNVVIEYHFAENDLDRLTQWAGDLVRRRAAVIVASGNAAAFAAKAATTAIPIVFLTGGDPVQNGLVPSLNRPGGNITGVTSIAAELGGKRLGLVHELLPRATRFAVLVNPSSPNTEFLIKEAQSAAAAMGRQVEIFSAGNNDELDAAIAGIAQKGIDALVVNGNTLFSNRRVQLVTLTSHYRLPAIHASRAVPEIGGLMSYGASATEEFRQGAIYTGRILKGEKPADLPVVRADKLEFVINLHTARTLGIEIPATLLARADEVIE